MLTGARWTDGIIVVIIGHRSSMAATGSIRFGPLLQFSTHLHLAYKWRRVSTFFKNKSTGKNRVNSTTLNFFHRPRCAGHKRSNPIGQHFLARISNWHLNAGNFLNEIRKKSSLASYHFRIERVSWQFYVDSGGDETRKQFHWSNLFGAHFNLAGQRTIIGTDTN